MSDMCQPDGLPTEPQKEEIKKEVKNDDNSEMTSKMDEMQKRIDELESREKARNMRTKEGTHNPTRLMTVDEITDAILKGI